MRLHVRPALTSLALSLAAVTLASCGSSTTAPSGGNQITVENFDFSPSTVTVKVGDTVTWQWSSSVNGIIHNVTWVNQPSLTNSPDQSSGSYSQIFSAAGTYSFYCTHHGTPGSGMAGTVVVQ
jgi:plastocyanin